MKIRVKSHNAISIFGGFFQFEIKVWQQKGVVLANFYFLFMTVLQLVPGLQDFYGAATTLMPLMFVVGVSMIKDAFEDNKRRKQDNSENDSIVQCCPRGEASLREMKSLDV